MCRGAEHWIEGPDEGADAIGLKPLMCGVKTEDEGLFVVQHKHWQDVMRARSPSREEPEWRTHPMTVDTPDPPRSRPRGRRRSSSTPRPAPSTTSDFETWLTLYAPDAEFWMPAWDDDDRLTEDPQTEISLIWYGDRGGLEDRVFRIRTERSSATSLPEPRTSHNISNVEITGQSEGRIELRFNWVTLSYRYKTVDTYFGTSFYTLDTSGDKPLILKKKVVLKNDYIHHVVDIYQI